MKFRTEIVSSVFSMRQISYTYTEFSLHSRTHGHRPSSGAFDHNRNKYYNSLYVECANSSMNEEGPRSLGLVWQAPELVGSQTCIQWVKYRGGGTAPCSDE